MNTAVDAQNPHHRTVSQIDHHNCTSVCAATGWAGAYKFRTPDMSVRESGKAENTGYPQQCSDGNDVESPSEDDALIQSPVIEFTDLDH